MYQILGTLYHSCSKKPVCAKDGKLEGGNKMIIDSNCPKMTYWGFSRNMCKRQPHKVVKHTETIALVYLNILWGWPLKD